MTILQDKSTGLPVTQPLPIFPDNPDNCENPLELETATSFETRDIVLAGGKDTTTLPKETNNYIVRK
ncbi:hypothetical protein ACM44_06325 [Chryseobacterium koreense CCUG 49689]|uniref:Uncharacterized protein n=1 Tax=Chryseobacterium koreense CCUG 49689 TaxID=1304281 RepID=A0A0J7J0L6_9FLAO|nr:hypothetical protein ACM44_06325 [Chryseobacterium koreense CCUG 49689]